MVFQLPSATSRCSLKTLDSINIGHWCLFHVHDQYLVGQVLGFSYLGVKTYKAREYSRNFANVLPPTLSDVAPAKVKSIGVLCTYYSWDDNGILTQNTQRQLYIDISSYKATLSEPSFDQNLHVDIALVQKIRQFIEKGDLLLSIIEYILNTKDHLFCFRRATTSQ